MKSSAAQLTARAASPQNPGYWSELILSRAVPAAFFSLFIAEKLLLTYASIDALGHPRHNEPFGAYMFALNQVLGLVYFTLIVVLFIVRLPRSGGRRGVGTVVVAFFGTFAMLLAALLPSVEPRPSLIVASNVLLAAGLGYSIWSLAYLGRSLSILPEARRLVTTGPYGVSRHPLYLGEAVASIGVVIPTIALEGGVLIGLFLLAQLIRIRWEEQVLIQHFPMEYASYRRRVPRYLPDLGKLFR